VTEPPFEAALISRTAVVPAFALAEATAPPPKTKTAEVPAASPARMNLNVFIFIKAPSKRSSTDRDISDLDEHGFTGISLETTHRRESER
jgi:hypothetical protein